MNDRTKKTYSRNVMQTLGFKDKTSVGTTPNSMPVIDPNTKEVITVASTEMVEKTPALLLPIENKGYQGSPVALVDNQQWVDSKLKNAAEVVSSVRTTTDEKVSALSVGCLMSSDLRLGAVPIISASNNRSGSNAQILTDTETYVNISGADMIFRSSTFFSADRYLMNRIPLAQNFSVENSGVAGDFNPFPPVGADYYGLTLAGNDTMRTTVYAINFYFRIQDVLNATTRATLYVAGMSIPLEVIPFDNTKEFCVTLWTGRPFRSSSVTSDGFGELGLTVTEDTRSFANFYDDYDMSSITNGPLTKYVAGPNAGDDVSDLQILLDCENCIPDVQLQIMSAEMAPANSMIIRGTGPFA